MRRMIALTAATLIGLGGATLSPALAQGSGGQGGGGQGSSGEGSGPAAGQPNPNGNTSGGATRTQPAPGSTLGTQSTAPGAQGANPPTGPSGVPAPAREGQPRP